MAYTILNGEICAGTLYEILGDQSVIYNSNTYTTGQRFRGILGSPNFTYSGTGTQILTEITELIGGAIEYSENVVDLPINFPETTIFFGGAIEYELTEAEKIVQETTKITGFAIEFIDYPFYSFQITETRL